ncbi:MAG: redox-sensing transcriptional repressor Rex [Candidatus Omnitrophica bacterium]|nr:redox-sensing transcriptional repressor Rex [Candidatus Omnitrophota bacterium]
MKRPPEISISRLAIYLRFLEDYIKEKGPQATINSRELAHFLDINHHQIRKDLSYFGKFGERGVGYRPEELKEKINNILGLDRGWNLCLCGMGNLGLALLAYQGFRLMRLDIVAIFDSDKKKIGKVFQGARVYSPESIALVAKRLNIDIAIIAVPQSAAQKITDKLIHAGIRAILNFAPVKLNVPRNVKLRNVDLATELINLSYFLSSPK